MRADQRPDGEGATPSSRSRVVLIAFLLVLAAVFIALGTWQMQRLFWKLDLIARVDARIHADPVPAPSGTVDPVADEYRRVVATGLFDHGKSVLVQAVTDRGAGFWVMTPLRRDDGSAILVNRGFVPTDKRSPDARIASELAAGPVSVTGLLRLTEPGGGFLRSNDPPNDRWFSRDVEAIAAAKGLADVETYFIDADATPNPGGLPVGGLTVVTFRNSHLVYALTWYALAAMSAGAAYAAMRRRLV
ncbi:SURF1 family protein [Shinella curvata]|uniref:SURF1-like protein n=1 Tax=Shinella curvata TaxID=1817964 RepID=A0ABT8XI63_9HYPH|nr:SURF1 family protein [Shinella curvata]MCJ8055965.1 SURF1 family protein [Shinella curvata]MDO6123434.1 SURF1 family protein [Shinella curvata]